MYDSTNHSEYVSKHTLIYFFSVFAWEPCYMSGGTFHPHPIECNKYFQCDHSVSLERTCDGESVFDSNSNVCVPDRPGIVCPDPALAPPKPSAQQTTEVTTAEATTTKSSTRGTPKIDTKRLTRPLYPARPGTKLYLD